MWKVTQGKTSRDGKMFLYYLTLDDVLYTVNDTILCHGQSQSSSVDRYQQKKLFFASYPFDSALTVPL